MLLFFILKVASYLLIAVLHLLGRLLAERRRDVLIALVYLVLVGVAVGEVALHPEKYGLGAAALPAPVYAAGATSR